MKTMRGLAFVFLVLAAASMLPAQITFSLGSSSWDTGGSFTGAAAGGSLLTSGSTPSGAYFGSSQPDANTYVFGLVNTATPTGAVSEYNVASSLAAGTSLTLTFTGLSGVPDYIAYTGGALTGYSYSAGTLSLTVSTINPVASASDTTGGTLGSSFGLMIVSGSSHNFGGTVFRTDMFWGDITPLQNYAGTNYAAGVNANGQNGTAATFYAYLPVTFLNSVGIYSPSDCEAMLQKSTGGGSTLGITRTIYTPSNPGFANEGTVWTYGGASGLNFDGTAGNDNYVLASYSNSSWSDGNIGVVAVPEPAVFSALFGSFALLAALRRRAQRNAIER